MENQSFKNQLKQVVKEYLDIDNEISTLQKALKERKEKKKNYPNWCGNNEKPRHPTNEY